MIIAGILLLIIFSFIAIILTIKNCKEIKSCKECDAFEDGYCFLLKKEIENVEYIECKDKME